MFKKIGVLFKKCFLGKMFVNAKNSRSKFDRRIVGCRYAEDQIILRIGKLLSCESVNSVEDLWVGDSK